MKDVIEKSPVKRACVSSQTASPSESREFLPVLLIDTREPDPHPWDPYLSIDWTRGTLKTGDVSLVGCEELIAIERKSLGDLISCLCTSRERFTKELQRAARIRDFHVICEGSYSDLFHGRYRSQMTPKAAWESVIALQSRYGIPFFMAGSVELAARLAESILLRWWREHLKAVQSALGPGETLTLRGKRPAGRASA